MTVAGSSGERSQGDLLMKRTIPFLILAASLVAIPVAVAAASSSGAVEFKRAQLRVEINATDGDAGLQIDLDHEPWRSLSIKRPDGQLIFEVQNRGVLQDYGLTELFSESSEPPFSEFPLSEFQKLFPAGDYLFEGVQTDGTPMRSVVKLTHDFPAGPQITAPEEDSVVASDELVVRWNAVTTPLGIQIVRYQVLVTDESNEVHVFSAVLPRAARSITVPEEFLASNGVYKVEVLAIERSGNQTLTELEVTVR
jgi:hypothetical protein